MKRMICMLLACLCLCTCAFAAENPFAPYGVDPMDDVTLLENEGTHTFVRGMTRVVAMVIERVPDDAPEMAVLRLMGQFEPDAVIGEDLLLTQGFVGVEALTQEHFGAGIDQLTVMILSAEGDLLILSGYDLNGDEAAVASLMEELLQGLSVDGVYILLTKD